MPNPPNPLSDQRAKVIAAIRALADFLEAHPELPAPNGVRAQHSIIDDAVTDEELLATVSATAARLGASPDIDDKTASVLHYISPYPISVAYVVHGFRRTGKSGGTR